MPVKPASPIQNAVRTSCVSQANVPQETAEGMKIVAVVKCAHKTNAPPVRMTPLVALVRSAKAERAKKVVAKTMGVNRVRSVTPPR